MSDYAPTVDELREAWLDATGASPAQETYYAEVRAEFDRVINRVEADAIAGFVNYLAGRFEDQISLSTAQHMISDYLEGGER